MAEAMEFDFSLPSNEGKKFDPELVEKVKKIQAEANGKSTTKEIPEEYTSEAYYNGDDLGADVLKKQIPSTLGKSSNANLEKASKSTCLC